MAMQIPSGLAGLLSKLGGAGAAGKGEGAADPKGLKGKGEAQGPQKGEALGNDVLRAGLGFNDADKAHSQKNNAEQANVSRFLQDPKAEFQKMIAGKAKEGGDPKEGQDAKPGQDPAAGQRAAEGQDRAERAEAREQRDALQKELRRDERAEGRQAHEAKEQERPREAMEAKEQQRQQERDKEEGRGGHGHARDQHDQDGGSEADRDGAAPSLLDEADRCHGRLADGARCLRKPIEGKAFCAEHQTLRGSSGVHRG